MKEILRRTRRKVLSFFSGYIIKRWTNLGKPVPPPYEYKQKVIRDYQKNNHLNILIETGTYLGDMVSAQKNYFRQIYSVELSKELFNKAEKRFKNDTRIKIIQGDSTDVLPRILGGINEPCIFWLDGHYSAGITAKGKKECPVFEELLAIFSSGKFPHVLLIDDARLFGVQKDYPTINELKDFIEVHAKDSAFLVQDDIIRVCLKSEN